jgi:CRP-like cAMP-binding protein
MSDISTLRNFVLFKDFSDSEVEAVLSKATQRDVIAGDWLFEEGSRATSIFFVKMGMLDIWKRGAERGEDQRITELGSHSVIGETAFLEEAERAAGARARENTFLWEVSFQDLRDLIEKQPALGMKFYRNLAIVLARRIRQTTNNLSSLKELKLRSL